jgi:hypothetical protein
MSPPWFRAHPDYARWRSLVDDHGLSPHVIELEKVLRPSIELDADPAPPAGARTRLGGLPDLPPDLAWPTWRGEPIAFVAQIELDEALLACDLEGRLPRSGLLSLFVHLGVPDHAAGCALLWFPTTDGLVARASPGPRLTLPGVLPLRPRSGLSVPPHHEDFTTLLDLDGRDAWHDEVWLGLRPDGPHHRLLGWPGNTSWQDDQGRAFVLQIDSDDRVGLEMGDVETVRVYLDGPQVDAESVVGATCTCDEG